MKKLIILLLFSFNLIVNAEVVTYERTEEDLRVNDWVIVTDENKNNILNTLSVLETLKVYDFANLLSEDEENNLYNEIINFIDNYKMDLVLVTINENYSTAEVYANDFYDYNNFGIGKNRSGLLILIDMDTREFYISTTGESILMYNDYRINKVLDDMTFYMQSGDYYQALDISIDSLSSLAAEGIPLENSDSYIDENGDYIFVEHKDYPFAVFFIISIIVATIVLIIFVNKNKLVKKSYEAASYIEEEHKNIKNLGDIFLTSNTTRIRINTDSSSGGGSSTHRSSSGSSHGGGGRRF